MSMNPEYYALRFEMGTNDTEIWLAMLSEWPFESFHEEDRVVTGYIQLHDIREDMMHFITEREGLFYDDFEITKVPDKNWNEVWESSFNPVAVDDYCFIMAMFHEPPQQHFKHKVIISPKMAFGTGHHATTYMMLQAMAKLNFENKRVFDYGCGTGILSVVAAMEGAAEVIGVDIQPEAIENSDEHATLNHVTPVCTFIEGDLSKAGDKPFDIILANINTKIIVDSFEKLKSLLKPGGTILLSGIMSDQLTDMEKAIGLKSKDGSSLGVRGSMEIHHRDDWVEIALKGE
jgi:ribosomal protein L11 methyltransferase